MNRSDSAATWRLEKSWSVDLPATGALIGDGAGRAHLAVGPLESVSQPPDGQPALYVPDFFLEDPEPWRVAAGWKEVSWEGVPGEGVTRDGVHPVPGKLAVDWEQPDRGPWEGAFRTALDAFESGALEKLVPVVFSEGTPRPGTSASPPPNNVREFVGRAIGHARRSGGAVVPYAHWGEESGVAGVSPELLFRVHGEGIVETVALAGTVAPEAAELLLEDAKLRHEHDVVVRFITGALADFGPVEKEPTRVLRLPRLAHLATSIRLRARTPPTFESLVSALHPTPALGGLPRAEAVSRLRALDAVGGPGGSRGGFGAPFGIRLPDGSGFCLVAIRNIAWQGETLRIGAGAGLVAGSVLETEWEELCRKIEAVRRVFDP